MGLLRLSARTFVDVRQISAVDTIPSYPLLPHAESFYRPLFLANLTKNSSACESAVRQGTPSSSNEGRQALARARKNDVCSSLDEAPQGLARRCGTRRPGRRRRPRERRPCAVVAGPRRNAVARQARSGGPLVRGRGRARQAGGRIGPREDGE